MPTDDDRTQPLEGRCNAHLVDGSGNLCRRTAGWGTDHTGFGQCRKHGGATRNGRKNGATLRARGEFGQLVNECGMELADRGIEDALADVIERTGAMALAWYQIVCQLQDSAEWKYEPQKGPQGSLQRWVTISVEGLIGPNAQGEQRVHVADEQYRKWLAMYLQANKVAADLGLEERKTRVQEREADLLEKALGGYLAAKGLELDRKEFARHLRLVSGGAA